MKRRFSAKIAAAVVGLVTVAVAGSAFLPAGLAAEATASGDGRLAALVTFDIPEQPLASALDAFGAQADLQVLYESGLALNRLSAPVTGVFTRREALQRLLSNSGLVASYADDRSVVLHAIVPISLDSDTAAAGRGGHVVLRTLQVEAAPETDFSAYDGIIAVDLQKALRRNVRTRNGDYRVSARIWLGDEGAVRRAELTSSTGDRLRDAAVFHTLQTLVVSRLPPVGLPEPVMVSIVVKPL